MKNVLGVMVLALLAFHCASVPALSEADTRKLDPVLHQLLLGRSDDPRLVRTRVRGDGEPEYAILVTGGDSGSVAATGAIVSSAFGNILVVHATREEIRKLVALPSVLFMESGTRNFPQPVEHPL